MLYKRLFDTHAVGRFDWERFFAHVGLDATEAFSDGFLAQCSDICASLGVPLASAPLNLDLLAASLTSLHQEVGVLDSQLELLYRWRGSAQTSPVRRRPAKKMTMSSSSEGTDEELKQAIAASLPRHVTAGLSSSPFAGIPAGTAVPLAANSRPAASDKRRRKDLQQTETPSKNPHPVELAHKAEEFREAEEGDIIGATKFTYQEDKLSEYLDRALSFWKGRVHGVRYEARQAD